MKKKTQSAFTLAEVLISLTIIGVIAAITVPTLIQNTRKQEYVSALQKAYSTLSQVTNQIIAENGSPKDSDDGEKGWAQSSESVYNMYKKYLNSAKECAADTKCMLADRSMNYGGWSADRIDTRKLVLADGIYVVIDSSVSNKCARSSNGYANDFCTWIGVDLNGAKKPNKWGRDFFVFILKENGLYPAGCDFDINSYCPGVGCACRVIREGKMDY